MSAKEMADEHSQNVNDNLEAGTGIEDVIDNGEGDGGYQQDAGRQQDDGGDQPKKPAIRMSPADAKRAEIASRFKHDDDGTRPFNGDYNDPFTIFGDNAVKNEGADGDDDAGKAGDQEASADGARQDDQRKVKIKVRGREIELTQAELIERAQKVEAADSYFEESRRIFEEAKGIKAERSGRMDGHQHQDGNLDRTQDDLDDDPDNARQHPGESVKSVIEKIQYGDPDEAGEELERLIENRARRIAENTADAKQLERLSKNDIAKAQAHVRSFSEKYPDFANDKKLASLMRDELHEAFVEDIKSLGIDETKIPATQEELAKWHRYYRITGANVRSFDRLLEDSKAKIDGWRGVQTSRPQRQQQQGDGRQMAVNVDRSARRAAIPQQPSPQALPRIDAGRPNQEDRSSIIAGMNRARGKLA